jgi:hypothetical protein
MHIKTSLIDIEGIPHIDAIVSGIPGDTAYFARARWPDDESVRPAVVAELLKTLSKAVRDGVISTGSI